MRFHRLDIHRVRNLSAVRLDLCAGLNFIHGANGAGKTAILEAVHVLCRGRSFRSSRIEALVQHGSEDLIVRGQGVDELRGGVGLAIRKDRAGRTEIHIDGVTERRISEVARITPLQVMLPDIGELVFGGPSLRRRWLDWGTFHVKPDYLVTLRECLRTLKQRNAALRAGEGERSLAPWTTRLVKLSERVTAQRIDYLNALRPHFAAVLSLLSPELSVDIGFQRGWREGEAFEKLLGETRQREVKSGATPYGPHRADVVLGVANGSASAVLSRGQGKLVASAMQIAQARLLGSIERRSTVFLIDDMGAELDVAHGERLLRALRDAGGQILATGTEMPNDRSSVLGVFGAQASDDPHSMRLFHVERGSIRNM